MLDDGGSFQYRHALGSLLLVLLVASAGCGGLLGSGEATPTATPTRGTATDTPTPTTTQQSLPAGIAENGSVDAETLAKTHAESLKGASYTSRVRVNQTTRTGQNARSSWFSQVAKVSGEGPFNTTFTSHQPSTSITQVTWGNRSLAISRVKIRGHVRYRRQDVQQVRRNLSGRGFIKQFLAVGDYSVETVDREAGQVVLTADAAATENISSGRITDYSGRLVVSMNGRIQEMSAELGFSGQTNQTVSLTVTFEITNVGETTVNEPDWLSEGVSQTSSRLAPVAVRPAVGR